MTKRHGQEGLVLVVVIMLTVVLSLIAISLLSVNMSQVKQEKTVTDSVLSEELAKGLFNQYQQCRINGWDGCAVPSSITVNSKIYQVVCTETSGGGPNGTDTISICVGDDCAACTSSCAGKSCGSNGCCGNCGTCGGVTTCNTSTGQCI